MVFALNGKRPMSVEQLIERVRQKAGLIDVRLHDLRRTLRTGLAELGVSFEVAERVLNHAMPALLEVATSQRRGRVLTTATRALHCVAALT